MDTASKHDEGRLHAMNCHRCGARLGWGGSTGHSIVCDGCADIYYPETPRDGVQVEFVLRDDQYQPGGYYATIDELINLLAEVRESNRLTNGHICALRMRGQLASGREMGSETGGWAYLAPVVTPTVLDCVRKEEVDRTASHNPNPDDNYPTP